jgi:hypothetical protein
VTVSWGAACPNGSPITQYQLAVNGQWQNVGTGTSFVKTGLADATTYSFQVRAVNDVTTGPGGNTVNARTPGPPNQVGGLSVSAPNRGQVRSSWSVPADNGKPIQYYEAEISPGGTARTVPAGYIFDNREDSTRYGVRARACNEVGCGPWSGWEYATTPDPPRSIRVSRGARVNNGDCSTPDCANFHITASGMTPNTNYQVDCFGNDGSGMRQFDQGTSYVRSGPAGNIDQDATCFWGFGGAEVYATLNGIESSHSRW